MLLKDKRLTDMLSDKKQAKIQVYVFGGSFNHVMLMLAEGSLA